MYLIIYDIFYDIYLIYTFIFRKKKHWEWDYDWNPIKSKYIKIKCHSLVIASVENGWTDLDIFLEVVFKYIYKEIKNAKSTISYKDNFFILIDKILLNSRQNWAIKNLIGLEYFRVLQTE